MQRVWPIAFRLPGLSRPLAFPIAMGAALPITALLRANSDAAHDYYCGRFALAGTEAVAGPEGILQVAPPSEDWARAFHSFTWLATLQASGLELHRHYARRLIDSWMERQRKLPREAHDVITASRRLISFIIHAPYLLASAAQDFSARYCKLLTSETARLSTSLAGLRRRDERMAVVTAIAYAGTGLRGMDGFAAKAFAKLDAELAAQILPDGGHISRQPHVLLDLLLDLLPLKHALDASRRKAPAGFNAALERMVPMLRMLSHFDSGLAVFRGVNDLDILKVRAVFEQDQVGGRPLSLAEQTGYARLQQGEATLIADIGSPQDREGRLAFEFADGLSRIIVNCGVPMTAGHSTVEFDAAQLGEMKGLRRLFSKSQASRQAPRAEVRSTAEGSLFQGCNPAAAPGFAHERRLYLAAKGHDLRGEERFLSDQEQADTPFIIRFHLHPSVKATLSKDGESITLSTAHRSGWKFSARGGQIGLDMSAFFPGTPRRTQQITITGSTGSTPKVNWAFKRIDKREPAKTKMVEAPSLPF